MKFAPALLLLTGCSYQAIAQGGLSTPLTKAPADPGAPAATAQPQQAGGSNSAALTLEAAAGLGVGEETYGTGLELRARTKFGRVATEGSANVGAFFVSGSDHAQGAFFLGSAGFSLLGAVYTNAHPYWNIGSPYVTAGVGHRLDRDWVGTLSVVADYSVRWGHTPNVPSVGLLIGVGDVGYAGQATPPPMSDREVIRAIGAPNATPNEGDARRE